MQELRVSFSLHALCFHLCLVLDIRLQFPHDIPYTRMGTVILLKLSLSCNAKRNLILLRYYTS